MIWYILDIFSKTATRWMQCALDWNSISIGNPRNSWPLPECSIWFLFAIDSTSARLKLVTPCPITSIFAKKSLKSKISILHWTNFHVMWVKQSLLSEFFHSNVYLESKLCKNTNLVAVQIIRCRMYGKFYSICITSTQ